MGFPIKLGITRGCVYGIPNQVGNDKRGVFVIPVLPSVIPAEAGISLYYRFYEIPDRGRE